MADATEEKRHRRRRQQRRRRFLRALRPRRVGRWGWRAGRTAYRALDRFLLDDGLYMASALAFSLILSIFPFILFLTAIAGFLGGRELTNFLTTTLFDVFPAQVANTLEPEIWNILIRDTGGGILTFSLAIMLGSVTSAVETVRGGLNRAYGTPETRSVLRTIPESILFVLMATLALVIVAFLAVIFPLAYNVVDAFLPEVPGPFDLLAAIRDVVTALVLAGLLWAFHRWLPAHRDKRPALWPGILFTLVMWHFAAQAFSWYLSAFADYTRYYAGLAGIVAAMLFFYIAAVILLFAAALNRAINEARREHRAVRTLTRG